MIRRNSSIRPLTLPRRSSGYHDLSLDTEMASASAIRQAVFQAYEAYKTGRTGETAAAGAGSLLPASLENQLPPASRRLLAAALASYGPVRLNDFSSILSYRLLTLSRKELSSFQDVGEDLAARMENCRFQFTTAEAFADLLKTRQLTHTRITRALCHILLGLTQADLDARKAAGWPVYLRALGFRESARPLLAEIKKRSAYPLLVKAADASSILPPEQLALFEQDVSAAHVYEAVKENRRGGAPIHEYTRSPIVVP